MKPNCFSRLLISLFLFVGAVLPRSLAVAFESDGKTDIVWQNKASGETAVWFMDFAKFSTSGRITNDIGSAWQIAATADFDRDGQTDLFWRNSATGENDIWLMRGTNRISRQTISKGSTDYYVVGTGDFNGDGYPDILWRHRSEDLSGVWFMNGPTWTGTVGWLTPMKDAQWRPVATGDFDNDGHTDVVWRHIENGKTVIWFMNGTHLARSAEIAGASDRSNQLLATGQFNPVGNTDLLWHHTNGTSSIWQMSGTNRLHVAELPTETNPDWNIVGTGGYANTMMLCAASSGSPPGITLSWRYGAARITNIEQKAPFALAWTNLIQTTNYLPSRFTSTNVVAGQRYEFKVADNYLLTALNATPLETRGKIILIVENSMATPLATELNRLKTNLVGDGWTVVRTNVPRHNDLSWSANTNRIASIKAFITNTYNADPANTKAVLLIGHIPIPYSGYINPDGHGGRALPADGYYGDVDGTYTDFQVNRTNWSPDRRNGNIPGDGKFDQNYYPNKIGGQGQLELAVGRIDFAKLPLFPRKSETDLLRQYLNKNDRYRRKQLSSPERVMVGTYFTPPAPRELNRNVYGEAIKIATRLFGIAPGTIFDGDPLAATNAALWGFIGGNGLPHSVRGHRGALHVSKDFSDFRQEPRVPFCAFYGSYFVDWDCTNNLMRAFLGTANYGLAALWFNAGYDGNQVHLAFEQLALGETLGSGLVRTANQNPYADMTHIALLGDPTLRMQVLAPATDLSVTVEVDVVLKWRPSTEADEYFVYRSTHSLEGPWTRLTSAPLITTSFTDTSAVAGPRLYQVRAAKLIWTGSGSYTNLSQGVFAGAR